MARVLALLACVAAGAASAALGGSTDRVTWFAGPAQLVFPTFGYLVAGWRRMPGEPSLGFGGGLYLYRSGSWSKARNADLDGDIEDAAFPDEKHGWIATYDCARAGVSVYRTADGGTTWHRLRVRATHSCGGGPTYLSFPNPRDGWLEPVSPNGPGGLLLRTENGGTTWRLIGEGADCLRRITAISASVAWMACGRLDRTVDGGRTWYRQTLPLPARWREHATTSAGDPRFFGDDGVVPVTVWSHRGKAVLFYATRNAGRTWELVAAHPTGGFCDRSFLWPSDPMATVSIASPTTWWVASGRLGRIDVTSDGARHWVSRPSLDGWCAVSRLTAGSAALAWVTPRSERDAPLYETRDGGRTWLPVAPALR